MSETLLILVGVTVFTVTVVGTLWYFYLLLMGLDGQPNRAAEQEVQRRPATKAPDLIEEG
jgi:hypothetical protein